MGFYERGAAHKTKITVHNAKCQLESGGLWSTGNKFTGERFAYPTASWINLGFGRHPEKTVPKMCCANSELGRGRIMTLGCESGIGIGCLVTVKGNVIAKA